MDQSEIHENVLNCLLQASITNFPSVESLIGLDLSHFYFTSKNSASAERTIDNLIPSKDSDPHKKCAVLAQMFSSFLSNASIRFFSIVNEITRKTIDLEPIRISPIRFDFIVNKVNQYAIKFASELPGSLIELSEENISLQAIHFLGQECKFQMVLKYKSKGARLTWLKPMRPFIDSNSQTVFLPVCITKSYPFVFEITPEFTRSDSSYFQFVSKYIRYTGNISELIMRVQSISIPTTENITDIINSIQWNDILLFWARKVVGKTTREVMPSLVRTAALLENQIGAKPNEELRKAVCSFEAMKALNEKKEDSFRYIDLICNSSPNMLSMIPKIQSGMCESFNGVYEERNPKEKGPSKEARKRQMQMEVFLPVGDKIPNEFKTLLPIYEKVFVEMAKK
ncbi:hypothetical protein GPJ56_002169 [Histomonas meleagridis]|uniref:uncharacterized protein n=1 Tax=Histomonas meleagridis TaxID=135588 RepID=UPI00355AC479|nr:hypothetical protein GPJ56_002169 [Histomonas meleagridis]KAH0806652.1 hypothetical protein GO595_000503 [Histomonas meleagridis]